MVHDTKTKECEREKELREIEKWLRESKRKKDTRPRQNKERKERERKKQQREIEELHRERKRKK
jgi:hypothetical protein